MATCAKLQQSCQSSLYRELSELIAEKPLLPAPAPINRIPSRAPLFSIFDHFDSLFFSLRGVCVRARVCVSRPPPPLPELPSSSGCRAAFFPSFILSLRLFLPPLRTKNVLLGGDLPSSLFYHFSPAAGELTLSLCV